MVNTGTKSNTKSSDEYSIKPNANYSKFSAEFRKRTQKMPKIALT